MSNIFEQEPSSKEDRRRTIIAVVLSTLIVSAGFIVQNALFPPAAQQSTATQTPAQGTELPAQNTSTPAVTVASPIPVKTPSSSSIPVPSEKQTYTIDTDVIHATLTNEGGEIVSLTLKKHRDKSGAVDLIVPGSSGADGLSLSFGSAIAPMRELMNAQWLDESKTAIEFSRMFEAPLAGSDQKVPFVLKRMYSFKKGEYLFALGISIEQPDGKPIALGANGIAYRLDLGPQIGPRFDQLPKNADYRKYIAEIDGKKKSEQPKANTPTMIAPSASWLAMSGKYFTFIAVPKAPISGYEIETAQDPLIKQTNTLSLLRTSFSGVSTTDTYYFYFGPKTSAELGKYEYADKNGFGLANLKLEDAMERSGILGWLENILKFLLNFFYKLIPNYGIAIILVTVLIKALFYPLTKKSSMSTARMAELQPKIQELQAKYKGNPQKLNQEMAELYKRENYNPMSGCLPLLIQFPLFIAMYNLFNNHFDLRGAMFIKGWINDLSLPESIVNFGNFRIPIVGWNDLRALPIIYLISQLLYGKFTQSPQSAQSNSQQASQMKLMMYGMPIMFFFILYDVPSGLLIYWITNNVLTILQQIVINDLMKKHKLARAEAAASGGGGSISTGTGEPSSRTSGNVSRPAASKLASGKNAAVDTKARPVGRAGSKEGFSEKVTKWLENQAAKSEKDKKRGAAGKFAPNSGSGSAAKGSPKKKK
jgi:YidC/Oxa1 family membrane protein insertase